FFFDHGKHLALSYHSIEIHCTTCHSHVEGNNHFEVNTNACVTCHLAYPKNAPATVTLAGKMEPAVVANTAVTAPSSVTRGHRGGEKFPATRCDACHNAPDKPIEY